MIEPRIIRASKEYLIGMRREMSVAQNLTAVLWGRFSPRIPEIHHRIGQDKISLQIYPKDYFSCFEPTKVFEKWAGVPVSKVDKLPESMETIVIPGGLYAVFDYKGSSQNPAIFQYIYGTWLPGSGFQLDDRPHFERLGPNYINADPNSEEEIWIPIRQGNPHTDPK